MMWSAVCSGSPHSHAELSASPHFFMAARYRPTPVHSLCVSTQINLCESTPNITVHLITKLNFSRESLVLHLPFRSVVSSAS